MGYECLPPFPHHFTVAVECRPPQRFRSQWSEVLLWTDGWFVGTSSLHPPARPSVRPSVHSSSIFLRVHSCSFSSLPPHDTDERTADGVVSWEKGERWREKERHLVDQYGAPSLALPHEGFEYWTGYKVLQHVKKEQVRINTEQNRAQPMKEYTNVSGKS